jgi:hypothetical protein
VCGLRSHYVLQKLVVFLRSNKLEKRKNGTALYVEYYVSFYVHTCLEHAMTFLKMCESRMKSVVKKSRTGKLNCTNCLMVVQNATLEGGNNVLLPL